MTQPNPQPAARPRRTGPILMIVIGATLLLAAPIAGVVTGAVLGSHASLVTVGGQDVGDRDAPAHLALADGERRYLLAPVPELGSVEPTDCRVTGPDRRSVTVAFAPATALNTNIGLTRYEAFAQFAAPSGGQFSVECAAGSRVLALPPFDLGALLNPMAAGALIGGLGGVAGLVLVIVGIVRAN